MKWRGRLRRVSKWTCTIATILLLGMTMVSRWYALCFGVQHFRGRSIDFKMSRGMLALNVVEPPAFVPDYWAFSYFPGWYWDFGKPGLAGLYFKRNVGVATTLGASLLYPVGLTALSTALLWRWDRRARRRGSANACPACGYDRGGLGPDAICPECGAASRSVSLAER